MITKLMSQSEYAKHRGVSRAYISKLVKQGKIKLEHDGKIEPEQADRILGIPIKSTNGKKGAPRSKTSRPKIDHPLSLSEGIEISAEKILGSTSLFEAQQYKEIYQALTKKLEYEKMVGNILSREEVQKTAFETYHQVRDMLSAIPERIAPLVAAETDLHQCTQILKNEIRIILDSMNNFFGGP